MAGEAGPPLADNYTEIKMQGKRNEYGAGGEKESEKLGVRES